MSHNLPDQNPAKHKQLLQEKNKTASSLQTILDKAGLRVHLIGGAKLAAELDDNAPSKKVCCWP